jgi:hypothetical protein
MEQRSHGRLSFISRLSCGAAAALALTAAAHTARADVTNLSGALVGSTNYTKECFNKGVPLPPVFGKKYNVWTYSGKLVNPDGNGGSESQSFISSQPTDIYFYVSDGTGPGVSGDVIGQMGMTGMTQKQGVCMAAIRKAPGTQTCGGTPNQLYADFFGVICQGTNGASCMWNLKEGNTWPWDPVTNKAILPPFNSAYSGQQCYKSTAYPLGQWTNFTAPPFQAANFDAYIVKVGEDAEQFDNRGSTSLPSWVGGTHLIGNREGACTSCHAGANMFINHPGSATDISPSRAVLETGIANPLATGHANFWFPSAWPNPIVPNFDPLIGGPWPQNPGPSSYPASFPSSGCFSCHNTGLAGGVLPALAGLNSPSYAMNYINGVLVPSVTRVKAPSGPVSGAMPPNTTVPVSTSDTFSNAMLYSPGMMTAKPTTQPNGLPSSASPNHSVHKSANVAGVHQHHFVGASTHIPAVGTFNADDLICFDGFATSGQSPSEVMIQFFAGGTWDHRAYWGPNLIGPPSGLPPEPTPPTPQSPANFRAGQYALPNGGLAGTWQPYCVWASSINLGGQFAAGLAFTLWDGSLYWGDIYRYVHGSGAAEPLFFVSGTSPPAGVSLGAVGESWQVMTTPVP